MILTRTHTHTEREREICTEREREREREICSHTHTQRERERERERYAHTHTHTLTRLVVVDRLAFAALRLLRLSHRLIGCDMSKEDSLGPAHPLEAQLFNRRRGLLC